MFLILSCALLSLPAFPCAGQAGQADIDEISAKFLARIDEAEKKGDWERIFGLYEDALRRHRSRVAPDPDHPGIMVGVGEYLVRRYSRLPAAAFDHYRITRDTRARQALKMAAAEKDPFELDRALSLYFFASMSDEYLDRMALRLQERGLFDEALLYWDRLLRYHPDDDIPREILLARMAIACRLAGNGARLAELKTYREERKIDGTIRAGRETLTLSRFLDSVEISPAGKSVARPAPVPDIPRRTGERDPRFIRNDILWWTYDFGAKGKKTAKGTGLRIGRTVATTNRVAEYPLRPAHCRLDGREYILFTNGYRVVAVNPERVREGSPTKGVYWKYPANGPLTVPAPPQRFGPAYTKPYIGVTIDGRRAFATLYASRVTVPNNTRDTFFGPTRLVCFDIPTGRAIWSTDGLQEATLKMERREQQSYDYLDRNFALAGPPLVRGDRVYVGICTSPAGEQESRVLCLERGTGRPLWCTYLTSLGLTGRNRGMGSGSVLSPGLPMMLEEGGSLFVQTSLGVAAAIRSTTGTILWLARYRRDIKPATYNAQAPQTIRPANPPLLHRGKLWILPQDAKALLAFDRSTGEAVTLPRARSQGEDLPWPEIKWLLGIVDDWMVLGGVSSYVLRLKNFQAHSLAAGDTTGCGRGQVVGGDIYLSIASGKGEGLGLYPDVGSWRKIATADWKGENQRGNLLVAGSTLVVSTDKIHFYSNVETIRKRFAPRIRQSPPHRESLHAFADLMDRNGLWKDAIGAYLEYLRLSEGAGAAEETLGKVRRRLYEMHLRRGEEVALSAPLEMLEYFRKAKAYAPNRETLARMAWKIGTILAKLNRNREAIAVCREMMEQYPDHVFATGDSGEVVRLREFALRMIGEIRERDPQAYEPVEERAAAELRALSGEDVAGWMNLRRRYPNSRAAAGATRSLLSTFTARKEWGDALVLLREATPPEDPRPVLEILEKMGDRDRLVPELTAWGRAFGEKVVVEQGRHRRVHEIVREWLQKIATGAAPREEFPDGPLPRVGVTLKRLSGGLLVPLSPRGIVPPFFRGKGVLLRQGSSVEFRNVHDGSRKWVVRHPFGYSGIRFFDPDLPSKGGIRGLSSPPLKLGEILSVGKNSPAGKAGLLAVDVIELLNGETATAGSLARCLEGASPGVEVRLRVRRKGVAREISFRLAEMPSGEGSDIVGATFTQGYSLAIVWADAAVAVDLRSGKRKWIFPAPFTIRGMKEGEGTLLLRGNRASEGRLACLGDSTGTVRWIRGYAKLDGRAPEVLLSTSFRDETVSFFRTGSSADLRVFDRETGALLGKAKTFPQAVISYRVDEENRVLYLLHAAALKDRRILGLSLGRENPGEVVDTLALPLNGIGRDLQGSRLFVRAPHLVLMVPSAGQGKPGGVHLFNTKSSSLMFSIALPPGRAWSPGMCETSPFDSDGNLYVYTETVAFETGDRAGFLGAYGLDNPGHLKWEAVVPALPPSAKARWRVETRIPGRLLFVSPQGKIPGGKGEMPVAALYSKERGGYLEQVFPSLDNRAWGSAVSLERRRLLLCTGEGVEVYGAR